MTGLPAWGGHYAQRLTAVTLALYGDICHLCGQPGATTADHLVPRSRGGGDGVDNLRPAHQPCNSARGDRSLSQWWATNPLPGRDPLPPSRNWLG